MNMSNRNYFTPNKFPQNYPSNNSTNEYDRYKLPAINNGSVAMSNMNPSFSKPPIVRSDVPQTNESYQNQYSNFNNGDSNKGLTAPVQTSGMSNNMQQIPTNRGWSSHQFIGTDKTNTINSDINKNVLTNQTNSFPQRPKTSVPNGFKSSRSNMNISNGQKTIVRDRQLANEILQKAGISSNLTSNECLEVITDAPVMMNDNVNCDPDPLCMKKPAGSQECYEQSIVVRHLQPPRPPVPPPIIIREHCTSQPPPAQPPILIRRIPPRPSTPPPLIIRECPPKLMFNTQEPTIIEREVPPPPPPPRQVIVERLPTPSPKPRSIILEKWLPYDELEDRPCIVEKAAGHDIPPPKNVIIQYESIEPRIQPQCIDEGISYVDPKQFINDKPNGNVEVCYVDQLNNLPDHIKCQLSPQVLAAIGIQNDNKQNATSNNPTTLHQQPGRAPNPSMPSMPPQRTLMANNYQQPTKQPYAKPCNPNMYRQQQQNNRVLSAATGGLNHCYNKYHTNMLTRPGNQGLTNLARGHYNPWATTYQVSYTNKGRGMCRTR